MSLYLLSDNTISKANTENGTQLTGYLSALRPTSVHRKQEASSQSEEANTRYSMSW